MKVTQCVWLFATPWTIQSMEFSREEYWSVLPFPSPGDLSNPGIKPRSPILWTDSLSAELQGKPKNTGASSHSLLQGIFPYQGSNPGLLHYRWILYCLCHQGRISGRNFQIDFLSPWVLNITFVCLLYSKCIQYLVATSWSFSKSTVMSF